jgi:hypothetical protein
MANTYTATTDVAGFIPNYYSKLFLERLVPGPRMMEFCVKKPLPQGSGKQPCHSAKKLVSKNFAICWKTLKPFVLILQESKGCNNG